MVPAQTGRSPEPGYGLPALLQGKGTQQAPLTADNYPCNTRLECSFLGGQGGCPPSRQGSGSNPGFAPRSVTVELVAAGALNTGSSCLAQSITAGAQRSLSEVSTALGQLSARRGQRMRKGCAGGCPEVSHCAPTALRILSFN